jgi:hypothetical protein
VKPILVLSLNVISFGVLISAAKINKFKHGWGNAMHGMTCILMYICTFQCPVNTYVHDVPYMDSNQAEL